MTGPMNFRKFDIVYHKVMTVISEARLEIEEGCKETTNRSREEALEFAFRDAMCKIHTVLIYGKDSR